MWRVSRSSFRHDDQNAAMAVSLTTGRLSSADDEHYDAMVVTLAIDALQEMPQADISWFLPVAPDDGPTAES
jgi:hypothetical protein